MRIYRDGRQIFESPQEVHKRGGLTGFLLWPYIYGHFLGSIFRGLYLPQKSVLLPPIESQYKPFQKHVSFYILKRSPESFVWAASPLLRGGH
jgi:hypothetical protein